MVEQVVDSDVQVSMEPMKSDEWSKGAPSTDEESVGPEDGIEMSFESTCMLDEKEEGETTTTVVSEKPIHVKPVEQNVNGGKQDKRGKKKSFHLFAKKVKKTSPSTTTATQETKAKSSRGARIQRTTSLIIEDSASQVEGGATPLEVKLEDCNETQETTKEQVVKSDDSSTTKQTTTERVEASAEPKIHNETKPAPKITQDKSGPVPQVVAIASPEPTDTAADEEASVFGETFSVMSALTEGKKQVAVNEKDSEANQQQQLVALSSNTQIMEAPVEAGRQPELAGIVQVPQDKSLPQDETPRGSEVCISTPVDEESNGKSVTNNDEVAEAFTCAGKVNATSEATEPADAKIEPVLVKEKETEHEEVTLEITTDANESMDEVQLEGKTETEPPSQSQMNMSESAILETVKPVSSVGLISEDVDPKEEVPFECSLDLPLAADEETNDESISHEEEEGVEFPITSLPSDKGKSDIEEVTLENTIDANENTDDAQLEEIETEPPSQPQMNMSESAILETDKPVSSVGLISEDVDPKGEVPFERSLDFPLATDEETNDGSISEEEEEGVEFPITSLLSDKGSEPKPIVEPLPPMKNRKSKKLFRLLSKLSDKKDTCTSRSVEKERAADVKTLDKVTPSAVTKAPSSNRGIAKMKKIQKKSRPDARPRRSSRMLGVSAKNWFHSKKNVSSVSKSKIEDLDAQSKESISTTPEEESPCPSALGSEGENESEGDTMTTFLFAFDGGALVDKGVDEERSVIHNVVSSIAKEEVGWSTLRFDNDVSESPTDKVPVAGTPIDYVPAKDALGDAISDSTTTEKDADKSFVNILPSDFAYFDLVSDAETQVSAITDKVRSLGSFGGSDVDFNFDIDAEAKFAAITDKIKSVGSCEGIDGALQDDAKEKLEALADKVNALTSDGTCFEKIPGDMCGDKCGDDLKVCGDVIVDEFNALEPFDFNGTAKDQAVVGNGVSPSTEISPTGGSMQSSTKEFIEVCVPDELDDIIDIYLSDDENSIAASIDDDDDSLFVSLDEIILRKNPPVGRDPSDMNVLWEDLVM